LQRPHEQKSVHDNKVYLNQQTAVNIHQSFLVAVNQQKAYYLLFTQQPLDKKHPVKYTLE
jgi:hypothetical protein